MKSISIFISLIGAVLASSPSFIRARRSFSPPLSNVFAFGDSYTTVGFNVNGLQPNASNPIGNPAFPGKTTSGGSNWIGNLITEDNRTLSLAYDFAVAGATVDSALVAQYTSSVKSFVQQVVYFKNHYSAHIDLWNGTNSLFTVWFGINDINNGYYASPSNWTELAPLVISQYFAQAQLLYGFGARKFLFLTVPPIWKTPLFLAKNDTARAELEATVGDFNCLLEKAYKSFKSNKTDAKTWLFNTTPVFNTALENPTAYGSVDAACSNRNGVSCLWWNDFHPGLAIHKLLADTVANLTRF